MQATAEKKLHPNERLAALTGMITAQSRAAVGIRPKNSQDEPKWIQTTRLASAGDAVNTGMVLAGQAWPDQNEWDLIGCDDISDWGNATCYASFGSYDDWGSDPLNGNDGGDFDGFSQGV